jgi:hypothetical protein
MKFLDAMTTFSVDRPRTPDWLSHRAMEPAWRERLIELTAYTPHVVATSACLVLLIDWIRASLGL